MIEQIEFDYLDGGRLNIIHHIDGLSDAILTKECEITRYISNAILNLSMQHGYYDNTPNFYIHYLNGAIIINDEIYYDTLTAEFGLTFSLLDELSYTKELGVSMHLNVATTDITDNPPTSMIFIEWVFDGGLFGINNRFKTLIREDIERDILTLIELVTERNAMYETLAQMNNLLTQVAINIAFKKYGYLGKIETSSSLLHPYTYLTLTENTLSFGHIGSYNQFMSSVSYSQHYPYGNLDYDVILKLINLEEYMADDTLIRFKLTNFITEDNGMV